MEKPLAANAFYSWGHQRCGLTEITPASFSDDGVPSQSIRNAPSLGLLHLYFIASLVEAADREKHMLLVRVIPSVPSTTVIEHIGRRCLHLNIFIEGKVIAS